MKRKLASIQISFLVVLTAAFILGDSNCLADASRSKASRQTPQQAYQQLLTTDFFAFGGVGYAGTRSEGEYSFLTILASTNALELFEAVFKNGNIEAKLYALCGLRKLAPARFDIRSEKLATHAGMTKVRTITGCIAADEQVSKVIERIARGHFNSHIDKRPSL